ncbi:ead/Ea22-like family protein [Salmonella enterica subsp. enterica serovar Minnesota]
MTALNKQALREMAERAASDSWGYDCDEFNDAITPEVVLALLDELEAAEKRIAELSASLKDLIGVVNTVNRSRHHEIKMDDDDDPCYWQRKEWIEYLMETVSAAEDVYRTAGIGVKGE